MARPEAGRPIVKGRGGDNGRRELFQTVLNVSGNFDDLFEFHGFDFVTDRTQALRFFPVLRMYRTGEDNDRNFGEVGL